MEWVECYGDREGDGICYEPLKNLSEVSVTGCKSFNQEGLLFSGTGTMVKQYPSYLGMHVHAGQ